jgi:uncharacterized protein (DUF1810 family)
MPTYNGHKNYNHWNVSLWINNDEGLYRMALECIRRSTARQQAAEMFYNMLVVEADTPKTPDGAPYSVSAIKAAMADME